MLPSVNVSIPAMRAACLDKRGDGEQKKDGESVGGAGGQRCMDEGPAFGAVDLGWGARH